MGSEKAFLIHRGRPFISAIAAEMSKVSDDVVVMVGEKDSKEFRPFLEDAIGIHRDDTFLSNPLGGFKSGLKRVRHAHTALVGCDTPLVRAEVIGYLFERLGGHAAAVPVSSMEDDSSTQPLCAVYRVSEAKKAADLALDEPRKTAKRMLALMEDVLFVEESELKHVDPSLGSFLDVNTREEYVALGNLEPSPAFARGAVRQVTERG